MRSARLLNKGVEGPASFGRTDRPYRHSHVASPRISSVRSFLVAARRSPSSPRNERLLGDGHLAFAIDERVCAEATRARVSTGATENDVIAGAAVDDVAPRAAEDAVVPA